MTISYIILILISIFIIIFHHLIFLIIQTLYYFIIGIFNKEYFKTNMIKLINKEIKKNNIKLKGVNFKKDLTISYGLINVYDKQISKRKIIDKKLKQNIKTIKQL